MEIEFGPEKRKWWKGAKHRGCGWFMTKVGMHIFQSVAGRSLLLLLLFSKLLTAAPAKTNTSEAQLKRYVVFTETAAAAAVRTGAIAVRVSRGLKAVGWSSA